MPYALENLSIDRVDFVNEGSNSAAFIEIYKRKEQTEKMDFSEILSKLKPEHAAVIQAAMDEATTELSKAREQLNAANATIAEQETALNAANGEIEVLKAKDAEGCTCDGEANEEGVCKACGKIKKGTGFDETEVLKAMPENIRTEYLKMRAQKEAAEEQVRKSAEEKLEAEAVAKAKELKSLPVEQDALVSILKSCDQSVVDVLTAAANAIDSTVLGEVGKSKAQGASDNKTDANGVWSKIEAEADKVVTRDNVTKQKAIATVIKEQPELYKEYLNGGKN